MKNLMKLFVMLFAIVAFSACGGAATEEAPAADSTATETPVVEDAPVQADTTATADTTAAVQ